MNKIKTLLAIGTSVVGAIGLTSVLAYKSAELGVENYILDGIETELKEAVSGNIKVARTEFSVLVASPKYGIVKVYVKKHIVHVAHDAEDIEFDINDTDIISQVVSAICVIMEDCEYYSHEHDLSSDSSDDISGIDLSPVTIKEDQYHGVYSGGKYQAWYCEPLWVDTVLHDSYANDVTCARFWTRYTQKMKDETEVIKASTILVGLGDTPNEALIDLNKKVKFRNECIDKMNSAKQKSDNSDK